MLPHCGRRAGRPAGTSAASTQRVGASFARPARVTDQLSASRAVDAHPSANSICGHGALPRAAEAWRLSLVLPHCGRRAGRPAGTSAASTQRVGASFARPARVTDQLSASRAVDAHPSANSICGHGALPRAAEAWRLSLVLPHCGRRCQVSKFGTLPPTTPPPTTHHQTPTTNHPHGRAIAIAIATATATAARLAIPTRARPSAIAIATATASAATLAIPTRARPSAIAIATATATAAQVAIPTRALATTPPPTTHHQTSTTHHPHSRAIAIVIATATATTANTQRVGASFARPARVTAQAWRPNMLDYDLYSFARNCAPPHVGADESRARVPSSAALER